MAANRQDYHVAGGKWVAGLALFIGLVVFALLACMGIRGVSAAPALSSTGPTTSVAAIPTACAGAWSLMSSPVLGGGADTLSGVSATSSNDVWAVGSYTAITISRALAQHWNGTTWDHVSSPNASDLDNVFFDVVSLAPDDVWAVGGYRPGKLFHLVPLIEHWDGTQWSVVPTPAGISTGALYSISAISPGDIWAVGQATPFLDLKDGTGDTPNGNWVAIAMHWNGTAWQVVPPQQTGISSDLRSVSATSSHDVWAVGYFYQPQTTFLPLVEHWNGSTWTVIDAPGGPGNNALLGVTALAPDNVWAVGHGVLAGEADRALVEHWNGSTWSIVPVPNTGIGDDLYDVAAISATNIWAVGSTYSGGDFVTWSLHYDGAAWSTVPTPNAVGVTDNLLFATTTLPTGEVWSVGYYNTPAAHFFPLVERYLPNCGTTPTPTVCDIAGRFSDVHPSEYFYEAVQYLVCHNVVTGSSDGTFRPWSGSTRGQAAKIVVLAMGWTYTPRGGPHFDDVPPGSTFYRFVETAYNYGIISGYSNGLFHPEGPVTRGQLAKMLVLARNWLLDTSAGPHYSDVPPTDAYYPYVETATRHRVISGYADGRFLPYGSVTRGQTAKMVYLSLTMPSERQEK